MGFFWWDATVCASCVWLPSNRRASTSKAHSPAMTSKSIWTRRDGSAGGSVAQREAPCGEFSAVVQTSKSRLHLSSFGRRRDRALSLQINFITSINPPPSFSFKFLRLVICCYSCVVLPRTVEEFASLATSTASGVIIMSLHMPEDAASVLEQFMHDGRSPFCGILRDLVVLT